jgi:hypothetical protein
VRHAASQLGHFAPLRPIALRTCTDRKEGNPSNEQAIFLCPRYAAWQFGRPSSWSSPRSWRRNINPLIMLGFGMWWLQRVEAAARRAGEGYGDETSITPEAGIGGLVVRECATTAHEFDPA